MEAHADDCKVSAAARTAKNAFAAAVDWRIIKRLSAVSIRDGTRHYSIAEFASAIAQHEISEKTV